MQTTYHRKGRCRATSKASSCTIPAPASCFGTLATCCLVPPLVSIRCKLRQWIPGRLCLLNASLWVSLVSTASATSWVSWPQIISWGPPSTTTTRLQELAAPVPPDSAACFKALIRSFMIKNCIRWWRAWRSPGSLELQDQLSCQLLASMQEATRTSLRQLLPEMICRRSVWSTVFRLIFSRQAAFRQAAPPRCGLLLLRRHPWIIAAGTAWVQQLLVGLSPLLIAVTLRLPAPWFPSETSKLSTSML